jgi:ribosomal-protein-alanine N-acetyltransferase
MTRDNQIYTIRKSLPVDREEMVAFFNLPVHLHQHLDWQSIPDRVNGMDFLLAERNHNLTAMLSIPVRNPEVAWIEIFASKKMISLTRSWQALFNSFADNIQIANPNLKIFSLSYYPWYQKLLESSNFQPVYSIVTLETDGIYVPAVRPFPSNINLQLMTINNFDMAYHLDSIAFDTPWQMSEIALKKAFRTSIYATVAMDNDQAVGYQISTEGENNIHLARIAVHPDYQNHGIGGILIHDLLSYMKRFHFRSLSVNTQSNNEASLALYRKMGFYKTGNSIPIMVYNL